MHFTRYFNKYIYANGTDLGQSFFGPAQKDSKKLDEYLIIILSKRKVFLFLLEIQRKLSSAKKYLVSKISQIHQWQLQS